MVDRTMFGDSPYAYRGPQFDYKKMFYSNPDQAKQLPITLAPGYGVIELGTALAKNASAAGNVGKYVPYDPTTVTGAENAPGRAYLVQSSGTTATELYVSMQDSYKFVVGDDVFIHDSVTAAENLGAITAIDRSTYPHMAKITVTTATGGTSFTTARFAYLYVEGSDTCAGILKISRNTGVGVEAKGALGQILKGNYVLYNGMTLNVDSAARTDIGAEVDGQYLSA
jgi:hypothetical protein